MAIFTRQLLLQRGPGMTPLLTLKITFCCLAEGFKTKDLKDHKY